MAHKSDGSAFPVRRGNDAADEDLPPGYHASPSRGRSTQPPSYTPALSPRTSPQHLSPTPAAGIASTRTWSMRDPRDRSTDSLMPRNPTAERRTLLLIYIHGFHGDETSFRSFPAHVHNLATELLEQTHAVHTKIYPRYQSRKAIEFARDNFSNWITPHESSSTDVILLGHSMGGILSAEICLLAPYRPDDRRTYLHRILGTINFDVPFLGIHPGIVKAGLSSLFRKEDTSTEPSRKPSGVPGEATGPLDVSSQVASALTPTASNGSPQPSPGTSSITSAFLTSGLSSPNSGRKTPIRPANDPYFNPRYDNDVTQPMRKGWIIPSTS